MNGENLFNLDDTWVDQSDVEEELDGLIKEVENDRFLDEIGEMGEEEEVAEVLDAADSQILPVQAVPAVETAGASTVATKLLAAGAGALLIVEVTSISNAVGFLNEKDEIQDKSDSLNGIRDLAFRNGQWNDQLQSAWTAAMEALARRAEELQQSLKNTLIGKLIFWD